MIKINNDYFITLLVAIIKKHFFTIRINFKTEILSRSLIIKICLLVSQTLPFRRIKNQSRRRRRRRRRRRQPMTSSASQKQKREIINFFNMDHSGPLLFIFVFQIAPYRKLLNTSAGFELRSS